MPIENIITIIIVVLIIVFLWGIFKKLFKLMFYAGIIILLLMAANAYFIYQDFMDLRENFGSSSKEVLLVDGSDVMTGIILRGNDFETVSNQQLNEISYELKNKNYEEILGDNYKLMILDVNILESLDNEIEVLDQKMSQEEIKNKLLSGSSSEKATLFAALLSEEIIANKNPLFFFSQFKDGNIIIYPETALFKTVKLIPVNLFENVASTLFTKTKETAKGFVEEANNKVFI
ncbi:hypothetical protein HYW19_01230 [Candidatus Woesearchaeota archaeon]|nr:hypothetical protein [Candidatus Woesearchaeota archaeon]